MYSLCCGGGLSIGSSGHLLQQTSGKVGRLADQGGYHHRCAIGPCKAFLNQLTHLQVAGDSMAPKQLLCDSLTHLSFVCPLGWKKEGAKGLVKSLTKRYLELKTVATTQRKEGAARAEMVDKGTPQVVVYYSPREAIEADRALIDLIDRSGRSGVSRAYGTRQTRR